MFLGDTEHHSLNDKQLTLLRRDRIGFIFQSFNLLPTLTAAENIVLPMRIAGRKPDEHWVASIVETVGLTGSARPPAGAALRRPAAAGGRGTGAGVASPQIVFADEPTGALDSTLGRRAARVPPQRGRPSSARPSSWSPTTPNAASYADRVIFLADGHIVDEMRAPTADAVLDYMKHLGA